MLYLLLLRIKKKVCENQRNNLEKILKHFYKYGHVPKRALNSDQNSNNCFILEYSNLKLKGAKFFVVVLCYSWQYLGHPLLGGKLFKGQPHWSIQENTQRGNSKMIEGFKYTKVPTVNCKIYA